MILVVIVVFVGIALRASLLGLVLGIVAGAALAVRTVQMRIQVQGDRLIVRNFWSTQRSTGTSLATSPSSTSPRRGESAAAEGSSSCTDATAATNDSPHPAAK